MLDLYMSLVDGKTIVTNSYYIDENEIKRLSLQADKNRSWQKPIYDDVISKYSVPKVLDIGCGPATQFMEIAWSQSMTYVGVDYFDDNLKVASKRYGFKGDFYKLDLESDNVEEQFERLKFETGIDGYDVINISLVLKHLFDPERLLKVLHKYLKKDGTIIIVDFSSDLCCYFPDINGYWKRIRDIFDMDEYAGDSKGIHNVYKYLEDCGYSYINLRVAGIPSLNKTRKEKEDAFTVEFAYLDWDLALQYEKQRDELSKENLEWWKENRDKIREEFCSPNFQYISGSFIYTASP